MGELTGQNSKVTVTVNRTEDVPWGTLDAARRACLGLGRRRCGGGPPPVGGGGGARLPLCGAVGRGPNGTGSRSSGEPPPSPSSPVLCPGVATPAVRTKATGNKKRQGEGTVKNYATRFASFLLPVHFGRAVVGNIGERRQKEWAPR